MQSRPVARSAKLSRGWRGEIKLDYRCPWCQSDLVSVGKEILASQQCPDCNKAFRFSEDVLAKAQVAIQDRAEASARREAERIAKEESLRSSQREQQLKMQQQLRQQEAEQMRIAEAQQRVAKRAEEDCVADVTDVRVLVNAILAIVAAGSVFMIIGGGVASMGADSPGGTAVAITGIGGLLSAFFTYAFSRYLFAIHGLLLRIRNRLNLLDELLRKEEAKAREADGAM